MLPFWNKTVYLVAFAKSAVWYSVNVFPSLLIVYDVIGSAVPLLLFIEIAPGPILIGLLNLITKGLFVATFTALFTGSVLVITGGVLSTVKLVV